MKKILLSVAAVAVLASCSKEENQVQNEQRGNTYAGMFISTGLNHLKSRSVDQRDEKGREAESTLTTLDLLSSAQSMSWENGDKDEVGKFWNLSTSTDSKTYTVSPWKTKDGSQTMALVVNKGQISAALDANSIIGSSSDPATEIAKYSSENNFVMTSNIESKTIAQGISKETVKAANTKDETNNVFEFEVERVVAQGIVVRGTDLNATTEDGKGEIDLDNLTYAAVNGGVQTYLYKNNAGKRTMQTETPFTYENFSSIIDSYLSGNKEYQNGKNAEKVKENLIRLGNISTENNEALGGYKAITVPKEGTETNSRGIYFFENSVNKKNFNKENKDYGFYRLAYAKIYATYTPNEVLHLEGGKLVVKQGVKGKTFYKGADDGLIYASVEAAQASSLSPNQKVYTYTNGKCGYRALWNRQFEESGTEKTLRNADVRRNNIYYIAIDKFAGLGMPYDSSDPKDPNLPAPTDKENEGDTPDNPDVEKQDTYMKVISKVLFWNKVSQRVTLD